jgi:apolipoprotein N-acyltransferase
MRRPVTTGWLLLGGALSLFAVHGDHDLPVAAWLCGVFLLRYVRLRLLVTGVSAVWAVNLLGAAVWLVSTGVVASGKAVASFAVLASLLTVPYLLDRWMAPALPAGGLLGSLVFPMGRAGCEYLFCTLVGFGNYGSLAATQHGNLPLLQLAALTGSYGVSFMVAWLAGALNQAWSVDFSPSAARRGVLPCLGVLAAVLAGGGARLAWFAPARATVRIAGLSPARAALAERRRQGPVGAAVVTEDLLARTEREAQAGARIVVWSEGAARVTADQRGPLLAAAGALAARQRVFIEVALEVTGARPANEAVLLTPEGTVGWSYHKAQPTPMEAAAGITAGPGRVPIWQAPEGRLATVICYDLDFPALVAQAARARGGLLLVPANDWPGIARLHAEKAVVRAVENGISIFRQSGHGIATAVDPLGRVVASTSFYTTDAHTTVGWLPVEGAATVYAVIGDLFAWICLAGLGLLGAVAARGGPGLER